MLLLDGPLSFREFMTDEEVPLATVFRAVLGFLRGRDDVALFGAQAVNAYCETERMTQDVDLLATDAAALAEELRAHLTDRFHIAVRVREVVPGGFQIYQLRKPKDRHLVDIRQVARLPPTEEVEGVRVVAPAELCAMKVQSMAARGNQPKGATDRADLLRLLLSFPQLKTGEAITRRLRELTASKAAMALWDEIARAPLEPDADDGY